MTFAKQTSDSSFKSAMKQKFDVMYAVVLRDMRTRFFDHGLGFLVVIVWPLCHILGLLIIYHGLGRTAPFGDSLNVFFGTGLVPTMLFIYVSRFMSLSLVLNRPLLNFPVVQVLDVMMARAYLETLGALSMLATFITILVLLGDDPWPVHLDQAVYAYLSALLLSLGFGVLAGVITMFLPFFATIYALMMIFVYVSSGTLFVGPSLPEPIANALSYNPVFQSVEWMRVAYFETYSDRLLDRTYLISWGLGTLFAGLLLERIIRMRMLES